MSRRDQTRVGDGIGNCWQACLATLTGAQLEEVPDPRAVDLDTPWDAEFRQVADWLLGRFGLAIVRIRPGPDGPAPGWPDSGYWIACGPNPDGAEHSCVYRGQRLWHDPNPSRAGLLRITACEFLVLAHPGKTWGHI